MQRSTFKVLFYVKRQSEKHGQVPVMGRITINGTMSQFSSKLSVRSSLWDAKANKASGRSLEAQRLNEKLENIKTNIGKQYQRLCDRDSYVSAAKVPQSRRAGAHRAAGGFAADLPRRASAVRGFSGSGRAYRRQKSVPGRAPRWKLTSEPGYHPHRLRYGTEIPLTRDLLRGAGSPPLPDRHHPPRKSVLLGEAFGFASTGPENLRPSTRHRDLHRPIHTDINKTAKQ